MSAFLYGVLADRSLPQPILELCFDVARHRYGDEFFLWGPIGEAKDGYSILTPRIIDLAIATLQNESSEPNRVALAASLLIEMTSSIGIDRLESVAHSIERRLVELAKDMPRLSAITSPTEATVATVWSNGHWQVPGLMRDPRFAKNSELMSSLALIYHLGSPSSSEQAVRELIQATAVARQSCEMMLAEQTINPNLVLEWPFGVEQLKETAEDIRKLSPDMLRAASANVFAELLLQSISSRKAHEAEKQDSRILAKLPQAYRDFAKWNLWGLGDIRRADIDKLQNSLVTKRSKEWLWVVLNARVSDVSVLEYAKRLAKVDHDSTDSVNTYP